MQLSNIPDPGVPLVRLPTDSGWSWFHPTIRFRFYRINRNSNIHGVVSMHWFDSTGNTAMIDAFEILNSKLDRWYAQHAFCTRTLKTRGAGTLPQQLQNTCCANVCWTNRVVDTICMLAACIYLETPHIVNIMVRHLCKFFSTLTALFCSWFQRRHSSRSWCISRLLSRYIK